MSQVRIAIALAISGATARLVMMQWLHPLNIDEREFYRAARWIAEGRLPFRDFWEHHTPFSWFVYAPFTLLTDSPGVAAVLVMRWVQVPVWIATFWLVNVWMRNAGVERFARWSAMTLALCSSFLMLPAVEFRVDPLACMCFMAALVCLQRSAFLGAGIALGLAVLTNLRLVPLVAVTTLVLLIADTQERTWRAAAQRVRVIAGGAITAAAAAMYFVVTGSWSAMVRYLYIENTIGYGEAQLVGMIGGGVHRFLLVPFGIRIITTDRFFDVAAIDVGGATLLILSYIGLVRAIRSWRTPDDFWVLAFVQTVNLVVVLGLPFIHNYHTELFGVLMIPLAALVIARIPRRAMVMAVLALAWCVSLFASLFRGKELDLAYQDLILREVHARTRPGDKVWSGMVWSLRREPAYHFWFLPGIVRPLVRLGHAPPYVPVEPPAAVVADFWSLGWFITVQPDVGLYFIRHYMPVWHDLWLPGLNARLRPNTEPAQWAVPMDGTYRVYVSRELARHRWYRRPMSVAAVEATYSPYLAFTLPDPGSDARVQWWIDGKPVVPGEAVDLRRGQRVAAALREGEPVAVLLLRGDDRKLFRLPPPGISLEGSASKVTHVPQFGVRIE